MRKCNKCKAIISASFDDAVSKGGFNNPKQVTLQSLKKEMCKECYETNLSRK